MQWILTFSKAQTIETACRPRTPAIFRDLAIMSRMCAVIFKFFHSSTSSSELPDHSQINDNDPDKHDDMLASDYAELCNLW